MSFTLLTLNCAQFPYPIGMDNREERLRLASIHIKSINPDIAVFQEMWSNYLRGYFYELVRKEYPYWYADPAWGKFLIGMHSGLMIISKYPISRAGMHHFTNFRGPEHFAKKGILGAEILIGEKVVNIFTTHLQAGSGGSILEWLDKNLPPTNIISSLEAQEIRCFIDTFVLNGSALLAGDFNIDANAESDAEEWARCLLALKTAKDTFSGNSSAGSTWYNSEQSSERIDHILAMDDHVDGSSDIIKSIGANITDHLAVLGTFTLKN